ncbi:MAG: homocysteine S-methyltransferase family protein [Candidatus Hydrogenedentes bacterium]|nr:homocysteine S-methyltransferase family protein [Candidatus Hydrogenedentota bacterium]
MATLATDEATVTVTETLRNQVVILDGAMGTMIQAIGLTDNDFGGTEFRMLSDLLVFSRPEAVRQVHLDYYRAGANAVETNTFGASPLRLSEYDFTRLDVARFPANPFGVDVRTLTFPELSYYLSRAGAELAGQARDDFRNDPTYDARPLFVFGSIGPSNRVVSSTKADLKTATFDEIAENFYHQVRGLLDGGVDALIYETQQDVLELKAAVFGGRRAMEEAGRRVPVICQVSVDPFSKMQIFNTDIHAAYVTLEGIGIDVFGINCSIGPDLMLSTVARLSQISRLPISVVPNAGLPISEHGQTVFRFEPERLAQYLLEFVRDYGVNMVGGCCGTTPDHIRAIVKAVRNTKPKPRHPEPGFYLSGPQEAVLLDSSKTLIMFGERLNVRGSQQVRDAVENSQGINHDVLEAVVHEQVRDLGVKVIDVCMDSNVVDTTETLKEVVHKQTTDFSGAMSLDSFAIDALVEAVKVYPGRPVINSISLEEVAPGVTKADAVISAVNAHDPVYVGLATGPKGPGATAQQKFDLAQRLVRLVKEEYGVSPERLFIDVNVFPVGSESVEGMNFTRESLEAIAMVKTIHPLLHTIVGVGNLTNGLAKKPYMRKVLTSVFLDEARKRGLDAAIINPNHYVFVSDLDPRDYELGLKVILERDMDAFARLEDIAEEKKGHTVVKRTSYDDLELETAICEKIKDGYKDRENGKLEFDGHNFAYADKIVLQVAEAITKHEPLAFINDYLMRAMKELGDGFARGEVSLPHLLKSADVMKQVMGFLEEFMRVSAGVDIHGEIKYKGTIVLGTVYQDVHSIGKDLAKTLFENYGYRVIDLGVMTPLQSYLDAAKQHRADAVGMSALLVQTSNHMITVSKMMAEQGLNHLPILVGGAPVTYRHAAYVAMAGGNDLAQMRSNIFYCPTAMDGVNIMNGWIAAKDRSKLLDDNRALLVSNLERAQKRAQEEETLLATLPRRVITFDHHKLLEKPWFSPRKIAYSLREFAPRIDKRTLFALNWKFGGTAAREKQGETAEKLAALFAEWVEKADREGWVRPQGLMAVFPCHSEGEEVIVYHPDDLKKELCRFDFTIVVGAGRKDTICAAQYFRPKNSGVLDAIGVQIATSGPQVDAQLKRFREQGDSESTLFLQGLSDRVAEDMGDHLHATLRELMGFGSEKVGIRWSPGYPAMANTQNNRTILTLMRATEHIGVRITDAGEFSPTGSTAAAVSFHPDAHYT